MREPKTNDVLPPAGPGVAVSTVPDGAPDQLARGSLSAGHIVFMVMAAVAPAGGAVALLPLAIALGVGVGTPGIFVVVALILLAFAVGYAKMVPFVRNAGAFYAYISLGIGRLPGLIAAFIAATSYIGICAAVTGGFGFFANLSFAALTGINVPWWVCAMGGLLLCLVLGYLKITVGARVLSVALVLEGTAILVMDIAILVHTGFSSFSLAVFAPSNVLLSGSVGIGIIYAFSCFQGFEGTAIYAEEAVDSSRTIPRATYLAILAIGGFYVLTSWAMIASGGGTATPAGALKDPGNFVYGLTTRFVSPGWTSLLEILIITSLLAGMLAFHNAISRYFFALARDGFMPRRLASVHTRHQSPHVAGLVSFVVVSVIVLGFAVAGLDPLTVLSTSLTGFGAIGLLSLITTTSLAVLLFFWRRGQRGWAYTVMPAVATLGFLVATVLSLVNYPAITGTTSAVINGLPWLHLVTIGAALFIGLRARSRQPERFARIGRTAFVE